MKRLIPRLALLLVLALGLVRLLQGYAVSGERWPNGNIVIQLQLGSAGSTLIDGNTSWDQVVENTLAIWNQYLNGVQFTVVRNSTAPIARGNGFNNAFFSNTVYGDAWGSSTIGITLTQFSGTTYNEADVIFNSTKPINSYRGAARFQSNGSYLVDLQRLALHEFGHALGLQHSSLSTAIMYPTAGDTDNLTTDDINGVSSIYGSVPNSATILANISTRALVQTGDNVMIGGFVISGSSSKRVIIRAIGPTLSNFGVSGAMQDPVLELHDGSGALITSNDDWQQTQSADIQNTGKAPSDTRESAILTTLSPGSYTAIVRGKNNTTGVSLVEAYDLDSSAVTKLANISTRALVQTGDNVMIGGVVILGATPKRVIIRAIGPTLANFGVSGAMQDPVLELHDGSGALITSNDNWQQTQSTDIQNTGKAPSDTRESAILTTLSPGNYTAIIRGKNNTTGVALVEVYDLD